MIDVLKTCLGRFPGEYADLRYEVDHIVMINLRGKVTHSISDSTRDGFHLRCLVDGGFSTHTFSDKKFLRKAVRETTKAAHLASRYVGEPIKFRFGPVVKENVTARPERDPRMVTLTEKLKLLQQYNKLVLKVSGIQTTNLGYREWIKKKYFVNSLGTELEMEQIITFISGEIMARDGTNIQNARVAVGGSEDFGRMIGREASFEAKAKIAVDLLKADPVRGGVYRVLLNPHMVGVFIHEAFGHFSEADLVVRNPGLLAKMPMGAKIGNDILTVTDDPGLYGRPGYRIYDDEGIRCEKVSLIKNGVLSGRLHSMETAADLDEPLNGHTIAVGCEHTPVVRMGNIYVEPGKAGFDQLLSSIETGLYICDAKGGSTMGDQFAFGAQYGYEIRGGKLGKMVRDINMSGNLFRTLKEVVAVGGDSEFGESGGCGKRNQTNPQSGSGGPHMVIDNVVIG